MHWEQEPGLLAPSLQAIASLAWCMQRKKTTSTGKCRSSWNATACRELKKVLPGRQAHPLQQQGHRLTVKSSTLVAGGPSSSTRLQLVSSVLPHLHHWKTISKIKDPVQEEKIFNGSNVSGAEISAATNSRQVQVSKCSRCGSRRHLRFQEGDLSGSTTSIQSTSSLEYRQKLQVNPNHLSSLWIQNYWWTEFCHWMYVCVYIYIYTHRVHQYFSGHTRKNVLPPLLPPPLPKFWGAWGASQTQSEKSQCVQSMLHLCRTHCKPVDVLRVVWEGDLLERKSTE